MNTTQIGVAFENKVANYFETLLKKDETPNASKKYSKIFKHKKYNCHGTNREIDFDITIENYNPHLEDSNWSSLIVIECKCYNQKVDISDIDEFESKINKISSSGIKGIIVTTKGFSKNGIEQAQVAHIGLVVFSEDSAKWIVCRNTNVEVEQTMSILLGQTTVCCQPIAYSDGNFVSIVELLKKYNVTVYESYIFDIPYLTQQEIQEKVNDLYKSHQIFCKDIVGELLFKEYPSIRINFDDLPTGLLATLYFPQMTIVLSNVIKDNTHRMNFTLAHELGHLCLHSNIVYGQIDKFDVYENQICTMSDGLIKRMEYQANMFASYLLMPQSHFLLEVKKLFKQYNMTRGYLYLDHQQCNINDVNIIIGSLSSIFNVSREAVKIRMINEKLLIIDKHEPSRIRNFFR